MTLTYLDHAASTPMRPEAIDAMSPFLAGSYANPSGSHRFAREARRAVDESRDLVAGVIGCHPNEVVFTGCGTESDNMAVSGAVSRLGGLAVCPAVEHPAVRDVVDHHGGMIVGVDPTGHVDLDQLTAALDDATDRRVGRGDGGGERNGRDGRCGVSVVSVMTVNNEVGTSTDVAAVSRVVRRHAPEALLHTDAVQAASWVDLRNVIDHVDLLALSGHKFGGPKGVGVLIERGGPRVDPIIRGGGQERERRSGTHNVAGIVALATALAATDAEREAQSARIGRLRDALVDGLLAELDDVVETVPRHAKVAGSAHVCIGGIESEALLYLLDEAGVCASAASACASGAMEPSHVLAAMGVDPRLALGALRLSLGHTTTDVDVDRGLEVIVDAVRRLRR